MSGIPELRLRVCNTAPVRPDGQYVLYWMIAARRAGWNFGLQRAAEWASELHKPLLVLEALRCGHRWASDRFHRFVLDGMAEQDRRFRAHGVRYHPYLEPEPGAGRGLLADLAGRACVVVTDEYPAFFLPRMVSAASAQVPVRLEAADSNGLLPLRAADRAFTVAHSFRRFLHKTLTPHLADRPAEDPLAGLALPRLEALPRSVTRRWPGLTARELASPAGRIAACPVDHGVGPVPGITGGSAAASAALEEFLQRRLGRYGTQRNEPEQAVTSGLSPYLHFGHVSAHQVFWALARHEDWTPERIAPRPTGQREGWWGMSPEAEGFVDQLVTWRELGFNLCSRQPQDFDRYESLPAWAKKTLAEHAADPRPYLYTLAELEAARTHDPLWNAAQTQLVREGRIHNYLRMLWGKKVLEWSASPQEALVALIELNDKYALDGRDPNSYSGIFWVFGRYDRAWGPERPIYGKVRFMDSRATARKLRVAEYIRRYTA